MIFATRWHNYLFYQLNLLTIQACLLLLVAKELQGFEYLQHALWLLTQWIDQAEFLNS